MGRLVGNDIGELMDRHADDLASLRHDLESDLDERVSEVRSVVEARAADEACRFRELEEPA